MTEEGKGSMASGAAERDALFSQLFKGKEDVFARRFESRRTGRLGYQSLCGNGWICGVFGKPKVRWAECPQRSFNLVVLNVMACGTPVAVNRIGGVDEYVNEN